MQDQLCWLFLNLAFQALPLFVSLSFQFNCLMFLFAQTTGSEWLKLIECVSGNLWKVSLSTPEVIERKRALLTIPNLAVGRSSNDRLLCSLTPHGLLEPMLGPLCCHSTYPLTLREQSSAGEKAPDNDLRG